MNKIEKIYNDLPWHLKENMKLPNHYSYLTVDQTNFVNELALNTDLLEKIEELEKENDRLEAELDIWEVD